MIFLYNLVGPVGLWIAGGYGGDEFEPSATVEFIAENNSNSQLVPDLPQPISQSPSMFLHNETIILCGGFNNLKTCLKLQEGTWTEYTSMKRERDKAAVVSTTTATFIFGGWRNKDTYEYLENNAFEWKLGTANITDGFKSGCTIAISQDEIWLIGGTRTEQRILSFNVENQNFTELPTKLKQERYGHQCAFIPGTRHLMITGGYINSDSTEIIDVETGNVIEGPSMNSKRAYHGIGVLNIDGQVYNAQTQKWELTNMELSKV